MLLNLLQQKFINAFKKWDVELMKTNLYQIVQQLSEKQSFSSLASKDETHWICLEFLDQFLMQGAADHIYLLDKKNDIWLRFGITSGRPLPPNPISSVFKFKFKLSAGFLTLRANTTVDIWKTKVGDRWNHFGFSEETILLARDKIQTPFPIRGEPDFDYKLLPEIHVPKTFQISTKFKFEYSLSKLNQSHKPFLDRYLDGNYVSVWNDLCDLGKNVRNDPYLGDATSVALETMNRVKSNITTILERLNEQKYLFEDPLELQLNANERSKIIDDIENRIGAIPISLCAFWKVVGSVSFLSDFESDYWKSLYMGNIYPDPLFVEPPRTPNTENWWRYKYYLALAPDFYHKQNVSGGGPYSIALPCSSFDTKFRGEPNDLNFVEYLRLAILDFGGFPGVRNHMDNEDIYKIISDLKRDLIPF